MADEQHELRRINWTQVFGFTHIFKSFKMAIHPSKLALAMAAVVTVFCLACVMDWFWAAGGQYVREGEIFAHFSLPARQFDKAKESAAEGRNRRAADRLIKAEQERFYLNSYKSKLRSGPLQKAFGEELADRNSDITFSPCNPKDLEGKGYKELLGKVDDELEDEIERIESILKVAKRRAGKEIKGAVEKEKQEDRKETERKLKDELDEHLALAKQGITKRKLEVAQARKEIQGEKIFASLLSYERRCIGSALAAVRYGNIFGGLQDYRSRLAAKSIRAAAATIAQVPDVAAPKPAGDRPGFIYWCLLGVHGMIWLMAEHWLYAAAFLLASLAAVALFGGALHRIAALHFAREEKISIVQALRFSCGKFLSYFIAPLIPAVGILLLGAILAFGGLVGNIPMVGNILMGILFFLALGAGLIITFLMVGLVAGAPLMYPTIAVEGSDSFDAFSRSYSYVLSRPWRAGLYGLVALIYGVICYVFVRLFVYLAMAATHCFVKWGVVAGGDRLHQEADKLDIMWSAPTFESLWGPMNWQAMTGTMPIGAWLIGLWVFLLAASVVAFLLSYAGSSTTVIYYLLRRKVDATDLDDVYVEETPEDEMPPVEAEAETTEQPTEEETPPQAEPPAEPQSEQPGQ